RAKSAATSATGLPAIRPRIGGPPSKGPPPRSQLAEQAGYTRRTDRERKPQDECPPVDRATCYHGRHGRPSRLDERGRPHREIGLSSVGESDHHAGEGPWPSSCTRTCCRW